MLETIVVSVLFVYIFDLHKRRRLSRNIDDAFDMHNWSVKSNAPWTTNGLYICSCCQCFDYNLVGHILQSFWLCYLGYNGTFHNWRICWLVTLTKERAVFCANGMLRRQLYTMNRYGSLHLYPILGFVFGEVAIYFFLAYLWRLLLEQCFSFAGTDSLSFHFNPCVLKVYGYWMDYNLWYVADNTKFYGFCKELYHSAIRYRM